MRTERVAAAAAALISGSKVTQRKVRVQNSSCFVCPNVLFAHGLKEKKKPDEPRRRGAQGELRGDCPTGLVSSVSASPPHQSI